MISIETAISANIVNLKQEKNNLDAHITELEKASTSLKEESNDFAKFLRSMQDCHGRWLNIDKRQQDYEAKHKRQSQSMMGADLGNRSISDVEQGQRKNIEFKEELQVTRRRFLIIFALIY